MVDSSMENEIYEVYRTEDARLGEEMVEELYDHFYASPKMHEILEGVHRFDKAHTVMLVEQEVIPESVGRKILLGLRQLEDEGVIETRKALGGHFHTGEAYLTEQYGEDVAGWIHTGRSSGDLGRTGARLVAKDRLLDILSGLGDLLEALLSKADDHTKTLMPGYTHMQHAQPTTFAHYLLSFEHAFERDFDRLLTAYEHTDTSPAGAAILSGSSYDISRERTMKLLGFEHVHTNTMDAIYNTDWGLGIHGALMTFSSTLAKLAEELALFVTHEYGFVELADRFSGTSSIMPQKKNPYLAEFTAGTAGTIYGDAVNAFTGTKGPHGRLDTMWAGFENLWNSFDRLDAVLSMVPEAISSLEVNEETMNTAANEQWTQATDIADAMVQECNVPFRTAHQITSVLVRIAMENGSEPSDVTTDLIDEVAVEVTGKEIGLSEDVLKRAVDPAACVESRQVIGGPNAERVSEVIADDWDSLERNRAAIEDYRADIAAANNRLESAIDDVLA